MNAPHSLCSSRASIKASGAGSTDNDHANVNFPPPLIHGVAVLVAVALESVSPLGLPESGLWSLLGGALLSMGGLLAGWAFREFGRSRNPVPPNRPIRELMDTGPFRHTRNPLYLVLALLHAGVGLVSGNAWVLLTLPPALLIVRYYVVAREEAYLARRFGQAYLDYQTRVRRWF